ncbi:MAG TPA: FIST N-terminal domain-containing protein [Alphaproteobacteria bacterium]|nr:FIST N-terminal domain-containing protein [Alphaproteobacteria bacterium]
MERAGSHFHAAMAAGGNWQELTDACIARLGPVPDATLGFLYATDAMAGRLPAVLDRLRRATGVLHWIGTVGLGVCGAEGAAFDDPAMAVMAADLPPEAFRLFVPIDGELGPFLRDVLPWAERHRPAFAVVHGDPRAPRLPELVEQLSARLGTYLVGGLAASRDAMPQIAGAVAEGGLSGALFANTVAVATGLTQGCSPIGPARTVTRADGHIVMEIDGRPALDVFKEDIGELLARDLRRVAGYIFAAFPVHGADTADYLVRGIMGLDTRRGWLAVGDHVAGGDRILFTRRDRRAAEDDLRRMLRDVRRRAGGPIRGAHYVSCIARGPSLFGDPDAEMAILREELGEVPLAGFYANGEICRDRLYAFTGVLTAFT